MPETILVARDHQLNRLIDSLEYVESFSMSARAAAWRGDEVGLETNLRAIRVSLMEAIKQFKEVHPNA